MKVGILLSCIGKYRAHKLLQMQIKMIFKTLLFVTATGFTLAEVQGHFLRFEVQWNTASFSIFYWPFK